MTLAAHFPGTLSDSIFHVGTYGVRPDDLWVVAIACACAASCAILGCFLVLRRMSLLGDAISHAILPGLALAFIVTGSRDVMPMLAGAMVVGLLTAVLSAALHRWGRVQEDAAMGVVFSSLFALGVLLISWIAHDVDLDPGCVLYGVIELSPFDTLRLWTHQTIDADGVPAFHVIEAPRVFVSLAAMLLVNAALVALFWKELKIVAFDAALAAAMGIGVGLVHYALMALVAATTVLSFEAVGSILVIAMLVAPPATALLLTDRLGRMVGIAAGLACTASIAGYGLAVYFGAPVAGMIAVVAGAQFVLALVFAPRYGVLSKAIHRAALSFRIAREDVLARLYRTHESGERVPRHPRREGPLQKLARWWLRAAGAVRASAEGKLTLTPRGLERARELVRGHRLWESYLAKHSTLPIDHLHEPAERVEHYLDGRLRQDLAREVRTETDPMGKKIPPG